jgi:hypothetical protein
MYRYSRVLTVVERHYHLLVSPIIYLPLSFVTQVLFLRCGMIFRLPRLHNCIARQSSSCFLDWRKPTPPFRQDWGSSCMRNGSHPKLKQSVRRPTEWRNMANFRMYHPSNLKASGVSGQRGTAGPL